MSHINACLCRVWTWIHINMVSTSGPTPIPRARVAAFFVLQSNRSAPQFGFIGNVEMRSILNLNLTRQKNHRNSCEITRRLYCLFPDVDRAPYHRFHCNNSPKPNGRIEPNCRTISTENSFLFMFISSSSHLVHAGWLFFFLAHVIATHVMMTRTSTEKSNAFAKPRPTLFVALISTIG